MSLEQLINIEVTSVSRRSQSLLDTASSVYVVTQDDIQRYGVRSVPEALRLVPGLSVSQIDGNKWAIGSRGFAGQFANKLLVMMDGRLLYVSAFSGVFWDVQDTLISEIDRIEVIRGPGSSVWGANAVNGVINIITSPASADGAGRVLTRFEEDGSLSASAAYSGELGDDGQFRIFVKHDDMEGNVDLNDVATADAWGLDRIGFRADWEPNELDRFTVTAEVYDGEMGVSYLEPAQSPPFIPTLIGTEQQNDGYFTTARWTRRHSDTANTSGQLTFETDDRSTPLYLLHRQTMQFDVQHQKTLPRHDFIFGLTYTRNEYDLGDVGRVSGFPNEVDDKTVNAFAQVDWTLIPEKLRLILGTKIEHHDLSASRLDAMPSVRLHWSIAPNLSAWAAVTHAIRTPSHGERQSRVVDVALPIPPGADGNPFPVPLRSAILGSQAFDSESLDAWEIGLRGRLGPRLSFDLALFDMRYDELSAFLTRDVLCDPGGESALLNPACVLTADSVIAQTQFANAAAGSLVGGELSVDWDITSAWRLRTSVSRAGGAFEAMSSATVFNTALHPEKQAAVRAEWTATGSWRVAASLRYVDEISDLGVEDFWTADLNVNWLVSDRWKLAFGGRNLLDAARLEYISELNEVLPTQIERTCFVQADWSF